MKRLRVLSVQIGACREKRGLFLPSEKFAYATHERKRLLLLLVGHQIRLANEGEAF